MAADKLERLANFALNEAKVAVLKRDYPEAQRVLEQALAKV